MLYDEISVAEIVDSECVHEFLLEATRLASSEQLRGVGMDLERKSRLFGHTLGAEVIGRLDEAGLEQVLGTIFLLRRRGRGPLKAMGFERLKGQIETLLHQEGPVHERFGTFVGGMDGLKPPLAHALGSELLHYTFPERYWLWTPWIWDPATGAGALPLVLQKSFDLAGGKPAETYRKIGQATAQVAAHGQGQGFASIGRGLFATNVFLACVYTVYMQTVFRMRLSKEFNRILPELADFAGRLLGTHRAKRGGADV